jgi:hypothetical protein
MVTPLELPSLKLLSDSFFEIEHFQIGSGAGQSGTVMDPLWEFSYRLAGFRTREEREPWQSFLSRLEGIKTPVLAFDPERRVPLHYYQDDGTPLAVGSPWGAPQVSGYDRAASTFDLVGWVANQELHPSDYISFQDADGRWHLHRLLASATASAGGAVTVQVTPRPARGLVHGNALLRVRDACCTAILRWRNSDLKWGANKGAPLVLRGQQISKALV